MGDREERDPMEVDLLDPGVGVELHVEKKMAGFMRTKSDCRASEEQPDGVGAARSRVCGLCPDWTGRPEQHQQSEHGDVWTSRGTRVAG